MAKVKDAFWRALIWLAAFLARPLTRVVLAAVLYLVIFVAGFVVGGILGVGWAYALFLVVWLVALMKTANDGLDALGDWQIEKAQRQGWLDEVQAILDAWERVHKDG